MRLIWFIGLSLLSSAGLAQVFGPVGENDFLISAQGGIGDPDLDANRAAVAYNSTDNEYLVVYEGDRKLPFPTCPVASPVEREIFGRRLDAETGMPLGSGASISLSGPVCDDTHVASFPDVTYNATNNEYLVVWRADDDAVGMVDDEFEIFGQLLNASAGRIGAIGFRISFMGGSGNTTYNAFEPQATWNSVDNEYLVVWRGDDNVNGLVDDEFEIFGQRLNENGSAQGGGHIRISEVGGTGVAAFQAFDPSVSFNAVNNQYLVVWTADKNDGGLIDQEFEIYGQRLDALGGEIGADDFRISDMGGTGDDSFFGSFPRVTWNATDNQYLVVWQGSDNVGNLVAFDVEIFGQRLAANGGQIGSNDFRISDLGGTGANSFTATKPAVTWNATDSEYLVTWMGSDDIGGQLAGELEIFGQRLSAAGAEIGANDFRVSDLGGTGNTNFGARSPDVTWDAADDEYLVVWEGDDNSGGLVDDEQEIFGQRLGDETIFKDGFE